MAFEEYDTTAAPRYRPNVREQVLQAARDTVESHARLAKAYAKLEAEKDELLRALSVLYLDVRKRPFRDESLMTALMLAGDAIAKAEGR